MYKIKTLISIADVIYESFVPEKYAVSSDDPSPDAIVVRSADMQSAELPEGLLAIARAGAGYNNVPVPRCSESGVAVFNTPGANANAVCEMVVGMLLLVNRNLLPALDWTLTLKGRGGAVPELVEKGKSNFVGNEIRGKRLGVQGLGAVGSLVANAAVALGMEVVGYDSLMSVESAWRLDRRIRSVSEDELVSTSDYLTLHIPLDAGNKGMINSQYLSKMKKGATILNFSRAGLAVSGDVKDALAAGKLRSYVVDFPTEEMLGVPGVVCIPHLASSTEESEDNCARMAAAQIADYLENGNVTNSVNLPACVMPRSGQSRIAVVHKNVPNTISAITNSCSSAGLNIANMVSNSRGELSYTMLDLDGQANEELRRAVGELMDIIRVRIVY